MSEQSHLAVQQGLVFCGTEQSKSPSTSAAGRRIVAAALAAVDMQAATQAAEEENWRSHYGKHFHRLTELSTAQPEQAVDIARAGLAEAEKNFEFIRGESVSTLSSAVAKHATPLFESATIRGSGKIDTSLSVPLNGKVLTGELLKSQIQQWQDDAVLEPEAAAVLLAQMQHDAPTIEGQIFILLGAAAEVGPCAQLLRRGATVVAVDIPGEKRWTQLIETAEQTAGTLIIPTRKYISAGSENNAELAKAAGADLLKETPEILRWLKQFSDARCIGCYAYLDGAKHVQLAMAMDFLVQQLQVDNPQLAYSFLLTPTDSYAVPNSIAKVCAGRGSKIGRLTAKIVSAVSGDRLYASNIRGHVSGLALIDCILPQQGPNYSLAKRIQRWRATVAQNEGRTVSANLAPATTTRSVTSNKLFAMGYAGCAYFGAVAFAPETTNALMAAMLLHDLNNAKTNAAATKAAPEYLFSHNAIHGGFWTAAYQTRSVLVPAVALGAMQRIGLPKPGKPIPAGRLKAAVSH